jgi:hypothetical protein
VVGSAEVKVAAASPAASVAGAADSPEAAGAAGAAVVAAPPQAVRAMLAMTRRLSKAKILRIFLLLKNLEGLNYKFTVFDKSICFLYFYVPTTTSFYMIQKNNYLTK